MELETNKIKIFWWNTKDRIKTGIASVFDFIGIPPMVNDVDIPDYASGIYLRISHSKRFTIVSVNGRDFWFNRLTGKFDGTGTGTVQNPVDEANNLI